MNSTVVLQRIIQQNSTRYSSTGTVVIFVLVGPTQTNNQNEGNTDYNMIPCEMAKRTQKSLLLTSMCKFTSKSGFFKLLFAWGGVLKSLQVSHFSPPHPWNVAKIRGQRRAI